MNDQPGLLPGMTGRDVRVALHRRYCDQREWILVDEMPVGVGASQRVDLFAINCYPSQRNMTVAFEIKASRMDFLRELRQPSKRRAGLLLSNRFYFAAPAGLINAHELPAECGLMEISPNGLATVKVQAPLRDRLPASWAIVALLMRTVNGRAERDKANAISDDPNRIESAPEPG